MKKLLLSILLFISFCSLAQQQFDYQAHSTNGSDTYTASITNVTAYEVGSPARGIGFSIIFDTSSSGACTLNVNGLGDITINGDITANTVYRLEYNVVTDEFDMISGGGSGAVESVTGDGVDNTDPANPVLTFPVASEVDNTPSGGIAATDVQAAVNELDTEKQPIDSDLTSWAGVTRATGFDTFVGNPTSANLGSLLTDEAGSSGGFTRSDYVDAKVANAINNGTTTIAPAQDAVFDALALKEDAANKTTGFGTVNNTLFPTVQAVVTYVASVTLESVSVSTSGGTITLDFNSGTHDNAVEKMFIGSATFSSSKAVAFSNSSGKLVFNFHFEITNVAGTITCSSCIMSDEDDKWDSGTDTWTPTQTGKYEMGGTWDGSAWKTKIMGPFN